ncbi:permease [Palleronia sp.]|uniref:permease n=1 Tax=Palleronia sp. TaxID=1940284 RepID=UPI0035C843BC
MVIAGLMDAAELLLLVLPQLAAGLLMGGLVARLVGREKVAALLGNRSGVRGLLLASFMGAVTPGGPFTSFPVVHALWMAGADAGALIAYLSAWSLIGLNRLIIWELPLMGGEFTALRMIACLPLPVLGGIIARVLVRSSRLKLKTEPAE